MKQEKLHERKEYRDVRELIEWAGGHYGERTAYSYRVHPHDKETVKVSFAHLRRDVRALATRLLDMGCAGQHCVLIGKLSYEWAVMYFATLSIGAVLVPLDRDWTAEDLAQTAHSADAAYLFCDEDIADKAKAIAARVPLAAAPVYLNTAEGGGLCTLIEEGYALYREDHAPYRTAAIDPDALSLLVFTSGTTGKGKGVMLSQHNLLSDLADVIPYIDFTDKTVGVLPPHHTYGSTVTFLGHTMIGAHVYISCGIRYVVKELREQKPGHLVLVPLYVETFYRRILATVREKGKEELLQRMIKVSNTMRRAGIDVRKQLFASIREAFGGEIRMIITGGAPINPEIVAFFDAIGIATLNGYGITECAPIVAVNHSRRIVPGSVGSVLDADTVRIDEPNEDGEGEILVKGPNVMLGYYKDEEATAAAFDEDGFFRTGDYGTLDRSNVLTITGRKKNLIILSNGKNVYPEEIENALAATPGVLDIIVYEGQSRRGMEHNAIVAEVFPDKDYCEANGIADIHAHLKSYVDAYNKTAVPYKKIGVLKVRKEEFPKNTLRKIMRFKLDMSID